jgi:hypothetical protein
MGVDRQCTISVDGDIGFFFAGAAARSATTHRIGAPDN